MAVSNATDLKAAISAGQSQIALEPGDYGQLSLSDIKPQSHVSIRSADPERRARFSLLSLSRCTNLSLEAIEIYFPTALTKDDSVSLLALESCENVTVNNCEVHSNVPNTPLGGRGISLLKGGKDVVISRCKVHHIARGLVMIGVKGVTLLGNDFDELRSDTLDISTCSECVIKNNYGARTYHPQPGDHCDFIQFSGGNSSDFKITGNVSLLKNVGNIQGIFLDDATFDNIEITDNIIATGMERGITINAGSGNTATFNTVIHIVGTTGAKMSLIGGALRSEHNIYTGETADPANVVVSLTDYAYSKLYQGVPDGGKLGLTINDFQPVPGSPAETDGAFTRIEEILSAE